MRGNNRSEQCTSRTSSLGRGLAPYVQKIKSTLPRVNSCSMLSFLHALLNAFAHLVEHMVADDNTFTSVISSKVGQITYIGYTG